MSLLRFRFAKRWGALAQLVERLHGMQEVNKLSRPR